jgi:RNA polymerase sigma factor (TIGR02999 family)
MQQQPTHDITGLLQAWRLGDASARELLIPLLQRELHRIARHHMAAQRPGHTLQTTALVNEAYLRLIDAKRVDWHDRSHFLAACSQIMRHILVDHARARKTTKRGGGIAALALERACVVAPEPNTDLVALDEALDELAKHEPRRVKVVEMRFFGGLSVEETAAALGISEESVLRDWRFARVWLARELRHGDGHGQRALAQD